MTGNFNKRGYDRTLWYTVSDEVMALYNSRAGESKAPATDAANSARQTDQTVNTDAKNRVKTTRYNGEKEGTNLPNGNFDVLNTAHQTDQTVTLGDKTEENIVLIEKNTKEESKNSRKREKNTRQSTEMSPNLPNGNFDMLNTAHQTDQTVTLICEIPHMDVPDPAHGYAKFSTPIPSNKPVVKQAAAASQKTQKNDFQAFTEALKGRFSAIDESLVFDTLFYPKAAAYLINYAIKPEYLTWLYEECREKEPKSLRGLYYKLFFEPDMLSLFLSWHIREEEHKNRKSPVIVCPVCGEEHPEQLEECPVCRLSKTDMRDEKEVMMQKKIFSMPAEERERYREEIARAYFSNRNNIEQAEKQWLEIRKKYHLLE
jgi:hypothetical protein